MTEANEPEKGVEVRRSDLIPLLYFIMNKFDFDSFHHSGTSGKADLLGGFIDRWINRISESLIFDKLLLKDKEYGVVNDFFLYDNKSQKNAPDVLGIKGRNDKESIMFSQYSGNSWNILDGMPSIEVKTYKKNDYMVTVRAEQMEPSKYFVLVEYELEPDYLKAFFRDDLFGRRVLDSLKVDSNFIKDDDNELVKMPYEIKKFADNDILGYLKLIAIVKGKDLMDNSHYAQAGEDVRYVRDVSEVDGIRGEMMLGSINRLFKKTKTGLFVKNSNDIASLGIRVETPEEVILIKDNKNSFYVYAKAEGYFNGKKLEKGKKYCIDLPLFSRTSGWGEYISHKNTFFSSTLDSKNELISIFDTFYNKSN